MTHRFYVNPNPSPQSILRPTKFGSNLWKIFRKVMSLNKINQLGVSKISLPCLARNGDKGGIAVPPLRMTHGSRYAVLLTWLCPSCHPCHTPRSPMRNGCNLSDVSQSEQPQADSVSRQDLLNMPKDLTLSLLHILHQVEQTGIWPEQLLTGFVVALEKQPNSKYVQQFRPIAVFPTAYRNYTSIRARQILRFLNPHIPSTCAGNLPHRYAAQMWRTIMDQIELGMRQGSDLSGGVIDLVKAFNALPRIPIMHVMSKLQVPIPILRAWSSATICVRRRFKILNKVGPPEMSTTGYAEGCALSCVAMLGFNVLNHCWCALKAPKVQLWSYVDNIEILGEDSTQVIHGMHALTEFCQGMDVSIDVAKSYTWSIDAAARRDLRQHDQNIVHHIRDLGCHMQYTKKVTNFTVTSKMHQTSSLWNRLARSLAPYKSKVRAIRSKAWPACLHAISAAHVADEHFVKLRTGATRGIGEHTNGMSPSVHLSLVEHPLTDPQFYAILTTVMDYRTLSSADVLVTVLESLRRPGLNCYPKPGPASVLLTRLHQVAWYWQEGSTFVDDRGLPCDILQSPVQELRSRLMESWQHRVQTETAVRPSMQGLQRANAAMTMRKISQYSPEEQAILRTCLNGSFYTADKYFAQGKAETPACAFCHQPDSQEHRHWHCPHFVDVRKVSEPQIQTLLALDPCLKSHGWLPEPPSLHAFRSLCLQTDQTWDVTQWPPVLPDRPASPFHGWSLPGPTMSLEPPCNMGSSLRKLWLWPMASVKWCCCRLVPIDSASRDLCSHCGV